MSRIYETKIQLGGIQGMNIDDVKIKVREFIVDALKDVSYVIENADLYADMD